MEPKDYIVEKIDGDYALLRDLNSGVELNIVRALIPEESDEGVKLHWENFEYSVIEN